MHSHTAMFEKGFQLIEGSYSPFLVIVSIVLAIVASYTALTMNERTKNHSFFPAYLWQWLASISLAFGIWSLHYMGMFSFALPIEIKYDISLTILSVIPSVLAAFVIFYYINKTKIKVATALLLSGVIAGGVASMHYAGMASMQVEALHHSNFYLTIVSMLLFIMMAFIFIYYHERASNPIYRIGFACLLGFAIAIVHYGMMYSMNFYVLPTTVVYPDFIPMENVRPISIGLVCGLFVLITILLVASLCDRYIEYRAKHYDVLTKLPNSIALTKFLKMNKVQQIAIWHFDDYDFINKTYGYEEGDHLMLQIVHLLKTIWSDKNRLYRIEKHRLAIVSTEDAATFKEQLQRVQLLLDQPLQITDEIVMPKAYCALSNENMEGTSAHLLEQALAVLSSPTEMMIGQMIEYKVELHNNEIESMITQNIQQALASGELFVVYQPKVDITHYEVVSAEALIRWKHPTLGFLNPSIFIPILEKTDQIRLLTDWIIEQVAMQKATWNASDFYLKSISINIPASYITSKHLLRVLDETVEKYKLQPCELDLEITETTFVRNMEEAIRAVTSIIERGYRVSLDDFGTGLSSLSYLKQMPISTMKIDKSFVDCLPHSRRDGAIIRSMFVLCESLELDIVVEGVEKEEQLQFLKSLSDYALIQGYYFSPPLQPDAFLTWATTFSKNNSMNIVNAH